MYKEIILSKILDYCKLVNIPTKGRVGSCVTLQCPFCARTANVIPHTADIKCFSTQCADRKYNLIDIARKVENLPDASEEDILTLLRGKLNLNVSTQKDEQEIDVMLNKFEKYHWALVPCARPSPIGAHGAKVWSGKEPIQKEWQTKENRDRAEWFHWFNTGLNMGVRTGMVSNLAVVDFDFYTKEEKIELVNPATGDKRLMELKAKKVIPASIKAIMGETLMAETLGGYHAFYLGTDLPKGIATVEGVHLDIETEGGQVVIAPSKNVGVEEEFKDGEETKKRIVGYGQRKFINDKPMIAIPQALYDLLKGSKVKSAPKPEAEKEQEEIAKAIASENFVVKDLEHNRNNTLVTLGGIFRKDMNITVVQKVLRTLNRHLFPNPLPDSEVTHIVESLDTYKSSDEMNITKAITDYLAETDVATKMEIETAVFGKKTASENKKLLDRILANLIATDNVIKLNGRNYKLLKDMILDDTITNVGTPINFKMPYFNDYAYFNKGDIILIGSQTKYGKTTLAQNFLKRLIDQKIKPIYLYNESGGRFGKTALTLGLKDGDFFKARATNPMEVRLRKNSVYVYDWIRPTDFAKTADIYESLVNKLEETGSIMIAFVQLTDKNEWFAPNLIRQFVAMSAKYNYKDNQGTETEFEINDVRDRKSSGKKFQIVCKYDEATREVKTIDEIDEEERAIEANALKHTSHEVN